MEHLNESISIEKAIEVLAGLEDSLDPIVLQAMEAWANHSKELFDNISSEVATLFKECNIVPKTEKGIDSLRRLSNMINLNADIKMLDSINIDDGVNDEQ